MAFIQAVSGMRHRLLLHDILGLPAASESVALKTKKQKEVDSARAPLWPLPGSVFSTHFCCGMSWSRAEHLNLGKKIFQPEDQALPPFPPGQHQKNNGRSVVLPKISGPPMLSSLLCFPPSLPSWYTETQRLSPARRLANNSEDREAFLPLPLLGPLKFPA